MTTGALFQALIAQIKAKLVKAQESRARMTVERWIDNEREVMLNAVNAIRLDMGKTLVTMGPILRAETHASGHVDYTHKLALYCAEIALGSSRWFR